MHHKKLNGPFPQDSWDAGHSAADAGELADARHPSVGDSRVYLNGYHASMEKRPDPRTDDPNYAYTPADNDYYQVDPDDHIQLLIDRWQQAGQQPDVLFRNWKLVAGCLVYVSRPNVNVEH